MYAPCDMVVKKVYGRGTSGVNTVWLESTAKVEFADGTVDYLTMMIIHPNDSDIKRLYEGMVIKKGAYVCYEGTDGTSGNHLHIAAGSGHMSGSGWAQNANKKWVLTVTGTIKKPEDVFYIDTSYTTVKSKGGISFKTLPKSKQPKTESASVPTAKPTSSNTAAKKYTTGEYKVNTNVLNVRKGPGTKYALKTFGQFSEDAQKQIKKLAGEPINGYVKGMQCTVLEVDGNFGRTPSGWICLDFCKKI